MLYPAFLWPSRLPALPALRGSSRPSLAFAAFRLLSISEQWLQRRLKKQLPADYFLLTFTLPAELRPLAWQHQRMVYNLMLRCSWETLKTFAQNDAQLHGEVGAVSVLHTHNRRLDYHDRQGWRECMRETGAGVVPMCMW